MEPAHTIMLALAQPLYFEPIQSQRHSSFPKIFQHEPQGLGFGIYMGTPTGFAAFNISLRTGRSTQQMYLNWNTKNGNLRLVTDQLWSFYDFPSDDNMRFPLYWGVRGWLLLNELNNTLGYEGISQTLGVGLPIGISMYHDKAAIDLYFEFAPVLKILPSSEFGMQAGIGLRMYPTLPFLKAKPKK